MSSSYGMGGACFRSLFSELVFLQNRMCRLKRHTCRIVSAQRSDMGDTRKCSQATYGCIVDCGVDFLFGLVREQTKNILKLLSLCGCMVPYQEDE